MRCINKNKAVILAFMTVTGMILGGCRQNQGTLVTEYEKNQYNQNLYEDVLYAENLCVAQNEVTLETYTEDTSVHSAALFNVSDRKVLYSYLSHERIYPASTTKIMTALLALENGNPEDQVTISSTAAASSLPADAQVCGLEQGEVWTLKDLVNALLLYSGNDAANAIAEHIAGSEEAFVGMMNKRARELMANNTHFMNAHGLHDDNHYTTAYDLYLIFNECIKNEQFVNSIQQESYTAVYSGTDGEPKEAVFKPTNLYAKGEAERPGNVTIIGGKTGTTEEAGNCLILLEKDLKDKYYISIVMGASDKSVLYADMTSLIQAIPETSSAAAE